MTKSWLVLVLNLIGLEDSASFGLITERRKVNLSNPEFENCFVDDFWGRDSVLAGYKPFLRLSAIP